MKSVLNGIKYGMLTSLIPFILFTLIEEVDNKYQIVPGIMMYLFIIAILIGYLVFYYKYYNKIKTRKNLNPVITDIVLLVSNLATSIGYSLLLLELQQRGIIHPCELNNAFACIAQGLAYTTFTILLQACAIATGIIIFLVAMLIIASKKREPKKSTKTTKSTNKKTTTTKKKKNTKKK